MNKNTGDWFIAHASVQGKSHMDGGIPNQDAIHVVSKPGNGCFAIAISDGAGSAKRSQEGSAHFAHFVAEKLYELVCAAHDGRLESGNRNLIGDWVIALISEARIALDPNLSNLRDFHCNLMAMAMGPQWGIRVHLGDAVLLKSAFRTNGKQVDYFLNTLMTAQERSEYANETHFVTEPDWSKHFQWDLLDPKSGDDMYALMTDGAADIALGNIPGSSERKVFRQFFGPLVSNVLSVDESAANQQIANALANPQTYRLTGDDKTLALVIRRSTKKYAALDPVIEDAKPEVTGNAKAVAQVSSAAAEVSQSPSSAAVMAPHGTRNRLAIPPRGQSTEKKNPLPVSISSGKASKNDILLLIGGVVAGIAVSGMALAAYYRWTSVQTTPTVSDRIKTTPSTPPSPPIEKPVDTPIPAPEVQVTAPWPPSPPAGRR